MIRLLPLCNTLISSFRRNMIKYLVKMEWHLQHLLKWFSKNKTNQHIYERDRQSQKIWQIFLKLFHKFEILKINFLEKIKQSISAIAKSLQSCPTLCDSIDGSPPGFPIPGILQARKLEWVDISFSNAWKWKVKVKSLSHVWPSAILWTALNMINKNN